MEVKEIQIGDWIKRVSYLNGGDNPPYITNIQIKNIYGNEINCKTRDYTILSGTRLFECEPISLTEELLLKNGFEFFDSSYFKDIVSITFFSTGIYFSCHVYKGEVCDVIERHINYVHELQHLLRLCELKEMADSFVVDNVVKIMHKRI